MDDAKDEYFMNQLALLGYSRGGGSVYESSLWNATDNDDGPPDDDEGNPRPDWWSDNWRPGNELTLVQSVYFDAVHELAI